MKFTEIKKFPFASYCVNINWDYLEKCLDSYKEEYNLEIQPEFQRGYVWTPYQQTAYVEYQLRGGFSGRDIFFNHPNWMRSFKGNMQLVDGQQRVGAVLGFIRGEVSAFGQKIEDFGERIRMADCQFVFRINNLNSEREVIEWYLSMNKGGSYHSEEDLKPAYEMLRKLKE